MRVERRGRIVLICLVVNRCFREEPGERIEVVQYSKQAVFEAYRRVKANKGAAGVDGVSIEQFEQDLKGNLFKLWNRISDVVRELLSATGADGGNTEVRWKWGQGPRGAYCRGQNRANGRGHVPGAGRGEGLPPRFLWVSAGSQRVGCGRGMPEKVLEHRLGDRFGHSGVFRQS